MRAVGQAIQTRVPGDDPLEDTWLLMGPTPQIWLCLSDGNRARLLSCQRTRWGRPQLTERDSIELTRIGREHHRPSPLSGKEGHAYADVGNEKAAQLKPAAREILMWLHDQICRHAVEHVTVFAPPDLLGALRRARDPGLCGRVSLRKGELLRIPLRRILRQPAIRQLLESAGVDT